MSDTPIINDHDGLINAILNLTFLIPPEIFYGLDLLTKYVGYIMPLRLYIPIISLTLAYILYMIISKTFRFFTGLFGSFTSLIARFR